MTITTRDLPDRHAALLPDDAPGERRFVLLAQAVASIVILLALVVLGVQAPEGGWAGLDALRTGVSDQPPAGRG